MNNRHEYEIVLVSTTIIIPIVRRIIGHISDKTFGKISTVTLSQYTNWNMILIGINYFYHNVYFEIFITINSSTIFIIYHIFRFTNKDKISLIPNVPKGASIMTIDICSFFVHILPGIVYIYDFIYNKRGNYIINHNIGYDVVLFNLIWAFQSFKTFSPCSVYFTVNDNIVYYVWCCTIISHILCGYICEYYLNV